MRPDFDIVVIGGGAGGLVVAAGGAALGAKVALVEKHRLGGDCLWSGCVPSKTLLKSARIAHQMRHADRWGIEAAVPRVQLATVMERVASVIANIAPQDSPERFRSLGVDVIFGDGRFTSPDAFEVNGRRVTAKHFVIATGSRPSVPAIPGLPSTPYLTNETVFALREDVRHLLVVGSGPVGVELAQAFRRLGSDVDVIDAAKDVLSREDRDVATVVQDRLVAEKVRFHLGAHVVSIAGRTGDVRVTITTDGAPATLAGTHLLMAAGRTVHVDGLGLEAAGVCTEHGRIVHQDLVTSNPRIFVIGDAAGGAQFTHLAEHHAGIVLRRAVFRMGWAKPSTVVPWATYTDPEIARVGISESEARHHGIAHRVHRFALDEIDRARAESEAEGFAKLVAAPNGKLLGAAIVAPHAGELIAECALAMNRGLKVADLSSTIHAYPTFAMMTRRAADQRLKDGLTPSSKRWIRRLFGLRGA